ncbi:PREDICTED: uncharacterized protein LOC101314064 [Fragaria vesca subsp. vesca]
MQYCVSCAICKDMKHKFKGTFTKSKTRSYTTITTMHLVSFYALIMLAIIYTLSTMCDAVTEHDLVSALQVSVYPEIIFFTKAGKILYLRKVIFILGTHPLHY